jgi:hypothetical protein
MKRRVTQLVFALLFFKVSIAQVGIGTTTPKSILDVQSTTSGIMIPRMTKSQRDNIVNPKESMTVYQTDDTTGYYFYAGSSWSQIIDSKNVTSHVNTVLENTSSGVLEQVTENGNTGYRIAGKDPNHHSDIGNNAFDLTTQTHHGNSGASGDYSFAVGDRAEASGDYSFANGMFTTASGRYAFASGSNTFATQDYSISMGYLSMATGYASIANGYLSSATAMGSVAIGFLSKANGDKSASIGNYNYANSFGETAVGLFNTNKTAISSASNNTNDRAFSVGIGSANNNRKDGFEVLKNGKIYADELDISEITDAKQIGN